METTKCSSHSGAHMLLGIHPYLPEVLQRGRGRTATRPGGGGGEIEEHYKWQGQGGRMERLCEEKKED